METKKNEEQERVMRPTNTAASIPPKNDINLPDRNFKPDYETPTRSCPSLAAATLFDGVPSSH